MPSAYRRPFNTMAQKKKAATSARPPKATPPKPGAGKKAC